MSLANWDSHRYIPKSKPNRGDFLEKYRGMQTERRRRMVALEASDVPAAVISK